MRIRTVTKNRSEKEQTDKLLNPMVSRLGVEPRTLALKGRCSTS